MLDSVWKPIYLSITNRTYTFHCLLTINKPISNPTHASKYLKIGALKVIGSFERVCRFRQAKERCTSIISIRIILCSLLAINFCCVVQ